MKILLVNPPSTNLYTQISSATPPIGLAYLAACLKEKGYRPEIIDLVVSPKEIDFSDYDIVGISSMTPNYNQALEVAKKAKEKGSTVVMGGYHVTFLDKEALETGFVDYVVRGEGEYTFTELLDCLSKNKSPESIKGISFIKNGKFIKTAEAEPPQDLDALPFPSRDLLELDKYTAKIEEMPTTSLITSRGCPFNCSFCSSSRFCGFRWRARSAKNIVDELEHLKKDFGYRACYFVDDNFTLSPKRVNQICDEMIRRKLNMSWWSLSRADTIVKNKEMVKKMAQAGAYMIFMGVESADEETLNTYGKRENLSIIKKAFSILKNYGIRIWASFILGAQNEKKKMIEATIRLAKVLDPHAAQFSILTPYPGTALWDQVKSKLVTRNWDLFDSAHSVFKTKYLSCRELNKYLALAYRSFYLRPKRILSSWVEAIKRKHVIETIKLYFRIYATVKAMARGKDR